MDEDDPVDAVVVEEHAGCREVVLRRGADTEVDGFQMR